MLKDPVNPACPPAIFPYSTLYQTLIYTCLSVVPPFLLCLNRLQWGCHPRHSWHLFSSKSPMNSSSLKPLDKYQSLFDLTHQQHLTLLITCSSSVCFLSLLQGQLLSWFSSFFAGYCSNSFALVPKASPLDLSVLSPLTQRGSSVLNIIYLLETSKFISPA